MVWPFLLLSWVAYSSVSQRCLDFRDQVEKLLSDQKKAAIKTQELEDKLKPALQQEITAQVEKQDSSEAESAATAIYYELRKSRIEAGRWLKEINHLRSRDCDFCEKEGGLRESGSRFCQVCPQSKTCSTKGSP